MANERTSTYGKYYGSFYNESESLTADEMQTNAQYIYSYLHYAGWSINAISALLGNMQAESSLNPGRWQSEDVGNTSGGYGLVQWTPASKYFTWCNNNNYSDPSEMNYNLLRINYEVKNHIQWIATDSYNYSFEDFTTSDKTVSELAKAFLLNYERPADQSASVQSFRASLAETWYSFLTGKTPSQGTTTKKRKGMSKILLYAGAEDFI